MGLDAVELIMAIEDAFGIPVPDADALVIYTPRDLANYVERRVPTVAAGVALEQRAFYVLRRAGMATLGAPRRAFQPNTRWHELIPRDGRRRRWKLLHRATGLLAWPSLSLTASFPDGSQTVGETAQHLAMHNATGLHQYREGWTRRQIEDIVARLIREQLDIESFDWDHRFIEDLGLS